MSPIPQVSAFWLIYVLMAGYLIGWTARHLDTKPEANWLAVKVLWWMMGGIGIFILGYSVAGVVFYK